MADDESKEEQEQEQEKAPEAEQSGGAEASAADKAKEIAGATVERIKDIRESSPILKSVRPVTWIGLALALVFLVGLFVTTVSVRWWIMLPVGAAGLYILWKQRSTASDQKGYEAKLCLVAGVVLLGMLIWRDAWMSRAFARMHDWGAQVRSTTMTPSDVGRMMREMGGDE